MSDAKLSSDDVKAIVDEMEARVVARFTSNVGRGVISLATTWLMRALVVVACYGAGSSNLLKKLGF